ncbi:MAG TPA: OmpA family protein [Vicinamibacterales bacterium]|jgi:outer membrane protein OmpA-like peptidoglycan-associated protein
MATNLIAQMMNEFRGDTLSSVASAIGETPDRTQTALGGVLPALIGGLANNTTSSDQANSLLNVIKGNRLDTGPAADIASAVRAPGGVNSLIGTGRGLLDSLLGGRVGGITDWVSSLSGINRSSSSSLLGLALPLVLGQIGKMVLNSGGNASSLMSLLGDQRQFLQDAPSGLSGVLGEPAARQVTTSEHEGGRYVRAYESESRRPAAVAGTYQEPARRRSWLWVLPLLVLVPLLLFLLSRRTEAPRQAAVETRPVPAAPGRDVTRPAPDVPRVIPPGGAAGLGAFIEKTLPNNVTLRVPAEGIERKLVEYIEDPNQSPTKETWFSFDRVEFEPDSATLLPKSSEQLQNIANIMKAYPNVKLTIGGYTDNTGDDSRNVKLSQDRATAAMNQITSLGIDPPRLSAEGFGSANPIADNGTPEGRQRNRRVDIRVTDK